MLTEFYQSARDSALTVLQANEDQARAEILRYGIERRQRVNERYTATDEGPSVKEYDAHTAYSLEADNPSARDLSVAAKILAHRQAPIRFKDLEIALLPNKMYAAAFTGTMDKVKEKQRQLTGERAQMAAACGQVCAALAARFPALAAFSELDRGSADLAKLAGRRAVSRWSGYSASVRSTSSRRSKPCVRRWTTPAR